MARQLRIEFPGAVYHITSRGNARGNIFEQIADKRLFISILTQVIERNNWLCHAYCLMDNHYHLLIETIDANLSVGMRQLNGVYTQSFNRIHKRVGHLFQGRYKSIHVEQETYLLELCRYIVLNPIRAGMVKSADQYTWSSYKATAGMVEQPPFLTAAWILRHFGKQRRMAQKKYRAFVSEGLDRPSPMEALVAQCILGSERFIEKIKHSMSNGELSSEIPKRQRLISRPSLEQLFPMDIKITKSHRNEFIKEAFQHYGYTQSEISRHIKLHYSTISRLINNQTSKLKT